MPREDLHLPKGQDHIHSTYEWYKDSNYKVPFLTIDGPYMDTGGKSYTNISLTGSDWGDEAHKQGSFRDEDMIKLRDELIEKFPLEVNKSEPEFLGVTLSD